jgi:hypothetical protein
MCRRPHRHPVMVSPGDGKSGRTAADFVVGGFGVPGLEASRSNMIATIRFAFFFVQPICMIAMAILIAISSRVKPNVRFGYGLYKQRPTGWSASCQQQTQ